MTEVIERYTFHERLCHWVTGFTYLYCLATGLAFYSPYLFWLAVALGGGPASRFWHPIIGIGFAAAAMWMHAIWRRDVDFSKADRDWMDKAKYYATNQDQLVPAQGRFNAGQKAFYWAMFYGALLLAVTGVFLWFPEYVPFSLRFVRPVFIVLHECAALITIGAFIIHVYMGAFMVPGSVHAMVSGYVSREWARTHHRLWYDQVEHRSND
ncbi:MAG TPA: formate dehydrogenase subunit gamma [Bryobacteraceae bacterium]|nr:formate dehydrogenase subunit gamma [Bryobacteraceae bacterium]